MNAGAPVHLCAPGLPLIYTRREGGREGGQEEEEEDAGGGGCRR